MGKTEYLQVTLQHGSHGKKKTRKTTETRLSKFKPQSG
jgi:hypothetical protein